MRCPATVGKSQVHARLTAQCETGDISRRLISIRRSKSLPIGRPAQNPTRRSRCLSSCSRIFMFCSSLYESSSRPWITFQFFSGARSPFGETTLWSRCLGRDSLHLRPTVQPVERARYDDTPVSGTCRGRRLVRGAGQEVAGSPELKHSRPSTRWFDCRHCALRPDISPIDFCTQPRFSRLRRRRLDPSELLWTCLYPDTARKDYFGRRSSSENTDEYVPDTKSVCRSQKAGTRAGPVPHPACFFCGEQIF
ncbi:hypothetical protein K461DRAFT_159966 [Myriangium duriaei CBS 260.36]|uniref:Uncharacterized protein n=1 Tax=Myriangium duriaei CBS 260.36 TaxID=1168546 RepID=A0A9P4MF60_9PEZI|nr:hypothetical protein K461DRAFT_159966 [Myriangium duriaei CBS 260.36]